jgi:hypothetical protein
LAVKRPWMKSSVWWKSSWSKRPKVRQLLANQRSSEHLRATSAYPPTADIRWLMSVIVLISSALPLKADVLHGSPNSRLLTQLGHSAQMKSGPEGPLQTSEVA